MNATLKWMQNYCLIFHSLFMKMIINSDTVSISSMSKMFRGLRRVVKMKFFQPKYKIIVVKGEEWHN